MKAEDNKKAVENDPRDDEHIVEIIRPIGDIIITTADRYSDNKMMAKTVIPLKDTKLAGKMKEFQTVVAVGAYAKNQGIDVGDRVFVNLANYADTRFKKETLKTAMDANEDYNTVVNYYIPKLDIGRKEHLRLGVRDIIAVVKTSITD